MNLFPNLREDVILNNEIPGVAKRKENDIDSILLEKVEGSDLNEDQIEDLLNLISLYQNIFIEEIEGLPRTPQLEFRVDLNDYSSLIQKPDVVGPVLEEIIKRLIQQYVDSGFYIRGTSRYVSPETLFNLRKSLWMTSYKNWRTISPSDLSYSSS